MKAGNRQSGVALLTALLVVALATVAAVAMTTRQQLDVRRTGNLLHSEQAWAYVLGAESWARVVLARDGKDNKVDNLSEDWASQVPASFVEGGSVIGRVVDVQGRFNVNSLVVNGEADNAAIERYKRLLRTLELDESLADSLVDWLDSDINSRFPGGAEDGVYQLLQPAYRAANRLMADISELRLVKGYDKKVMDKLLGASSGAPLVTALPEPTLINVNTASAEVLTTLADGLSLSSGEAIIEARGETGFEKVEDLLQLSVLAGPQQPDPQSLAVQSQWFLLLGEANVGQGRVKLASLIQRTTQGTRVIRRQREFFDPVQAPVVQTDEP
ncbi:general secretion pathway protein K [Thiogranum longum]|uniref:Type II secretion system protein K n=1 Tax=Thiogranum longum TaxID=1537524 RepID=A0A4R1HFF0_9GAMM|nr:type II secretion system minor pseudopilin GspK [Thiogranum longum]TCK19403.1 general secretion pathway protein K [Thiogranum longum]